ncbi:MAG: twin-arginine translocase TatA/TatE family subunit [Acidimicrobiales bacterium]|nr:twin-arginine translocase TatA/TatE family subunit [Acidimicrobiales bacterium]
MGNLGGGEILVILMLALLVLGPARLPEVARQAGKVLQQIRQVTRSFQAELQSVVDDPLTELAARARGDALVAEENSSENAKEEPEKLDSEDSDQQKVVDDAGEPVVDDE